MKSVLITSVIPEIGIQKLKESGFVVKQIDKKISDKAIIKEITKGQYDAVLSSLVNRVDEKFLTASKKLKVVANYAVGYNNFDKEAFLKTKIIACNTPIDGYSVAEFTASLIVTIARRILEADSFIRKGKYKGFDPYLFIGTSLKGKTLGVVGTGNIGKNTALIMHNSFDMNIVYYDIVRNLELENRTKAKFVSSPIEVAKLSDVVSIHVPLLPTTVHLVDKKFLEAMKGSAFLINTSRGKIVDEKSLIEALEKGKIKGVALDVFEFEPKVSKKLIKMKEKTVLTPHIGSATDVARNDMAVMAVQNIIDVLEGREPKGLVRF